MVPLLVRLVRPALSNAIALLLALDPETLPLLVMLPASTPLISTAARNKPALSINKLSPVASKHVSGAVVAFGMVMMLATDVGQAANVRFAARLRQAAATAW